MITHLNFKNFMKKKVTLFCVVILTFLQTAFATLNVCTCSGSYSNLNSGAIFSWSSLWVTEGSCSDYRGSIYVIATLWIGNDSYTYEYTIQGNEYSTTC